MIGEDLTGDIPFQPRARLLKLIGAELISDDVVAVTELVKNSHDADATVVTLTFRRASQEDGELIISDDGNGMDRQTLLERWMQPASSEKREPGGRRTARGRRMLGEKGVGRFASDKLASRLQLLSRRADQDVEIHASFDWDKFDAAEALLSEVRSPWSVRPATTIRQSGTILTLSGLRGVWTERMFRRLCLRLARLRSPVRRDDSFTIRIESDEFPQYSGVVRTDFLERSPYRIEVEFDGKSMLRTSVNASQPIQQRWNGSGSALTCGPVRVRIHAFDLETESVAKIGPRMEVRAWLREWSGISLYRDGFRVWPYGEPQDDWLRLDQRRVNNPVVNLSNNQVVGFVEISGDTNPDLRDQTNREGLINNQALEDLRRLVHFVLQMLEAERQGIRHPEGRRPRALTGATRRRSGSVPDALRKLAARVDDAVADEIQRLAERAEQEHAAEEVEHRRFIEGYSDLAALGQAAIALQETVRPHLEQMAAACERISEQARRQSPSGVVGQAKMIQRLLEGVSSRITLFTPLETGMNRRRRLIDVPGELSACLNMMAPMLETARVETGIEAPEAGVIRVEMRPETLARLLHVLVLNSLDWLRSADDRRIRVKIWTDPESCHIMFTDSGPGIPKAIAGKVFDPLFSTKEGGRGMGLTIAQHIVGQHGGKIYVDPDQRRKGANIHIELPVKRSRSTVAY
jgi:signal transduction histidine kinase